MRPSDEAQDAAYSVYLHARSKAAKASALAELLRVSEGFIARATRHFARGAIRAIDADDALQQARLGFVDAVRRADPSKGPLRPYCLSRIRHELQMLSEVSFGIKIPRRAAGMVPGDEGERPRIVTSLDAPHDGSTLADVVPSDTPSALDDLIDGAEARALSGRHARHIMRSALSRPAIQQHRISTMPEKSPLEALSSALDNVRSYLHELDTQEATIKATRDEIRSTLEKATGITSATSPDARRVIPLNQERLPHRIIRWLKEHPGDAVSSIADGVGEAHMTVYKELRKLRDAGSVKMSGKARFTTYAVASKARE